MAKKTIKAQMKQRRDTKANWEATNPVLLDGELGIVSDDPNLYKVGDGATAWNSLPFRGFDGTLAQELGTSPNAVISQKVVSEKLTELESEIKDSDILIAEQVYKTKGIDTITSDNDVESIVVETNQGEEIVKVDEQGIHAKAFISDNVNLTEEINVISQRIEQGNVEYEKEEILITNNQGEEIVGIDDDGMRVKSLLSFYGKKAVWLGTSIPATGYPEQVGKILGFEMHNESQGSSMCRTGLSKKGDVFGDDMGLSGVAYQNMLYSLTLSQKEKHKIFTRWTTERRKALMISEDGYTSEEVANVVGYGDILGGNFSGESGYPSGYSKPIDIMDEECINMRKKGYSCSWDSSIDIESNFGVIEGKIEKYLNAESFPDYWFIDHGHNDGFEPNYIESIPSNQFDRSYFIGSVNFIINKILSFSTHTKIILVGHYTNQDGATNYPALICNAQKKIAELWQMPLIKTWENLPFSQLVVSTQGYWDADGDWHNTGFDAENANGDIAKTNHKGSNYSNIPANIRKIDDVWYHDLTMKQIYMKDDLHPFGYANTMYANFLCKIINTL